MFQASQDPLLISGSGLTAQRLRLDLIAGNLANANTVRAEGGEPYRRKLALLETIPTPAGAEGFWARLRTFLSGRIPKVGRSPASPGPEGGVRVLRIVEDSSPFTLKYEPGHPFADEEGYVRYPNVDPIAEMVDLISAQRAYEANGAAIEVARQMASRALEIGRI